MESSKSGSVKFLWMCLDRSKRSIRDGLLQLIGSTRPKCLTKQTMLTLFRSTQIRVWFDFAWCLYGVFSGPLGQCNSVTYPRLTAGRRLDNLGVRMREHFWKVHTVNWNNL